MTALRFLVMLTAVVLAAGAAAADVARLECRFPQERARGGGWVPEILVIEDDASKASATVFDPLIRHFVGTPIDGARGEKTRARITYSWKFTAQNKGQAPVMLYRLTYFTDGRPATLTVQPGGYDNKWSGEGACKLSSR
jgi:uncharacterized protein (DUF58 family)